ncbi:ATP-binding protein [Kitasatospora sp. NBC_00240]|uniref:ATP-binding protein n=1 Tax=Kitasatospora sp. NBC_00240 TaxID=2903567 RepID=UPI0022596087|nr:ATP-binding protein [Kitasatospora sp. NBC_00240]MCX5211907.1 ATP-binding protein [Kitasatospora sp. NBC_00240]
MLLSLVRPPDDETPDEFRLDLFLPALPQSVPAVRHLLRDLLAALGLEPDTACLLLTELLSNAVRLGGFPAVTLELRAKVVRITVADHVPGAVAVRRADPDDTSGRGLFLVEALADAWGVTDIGTYGKAIWATAAAVPVAA